MRPLAPAPGYNAEATVSRDGWIVFTSTRDGDLDLYKMRLDGSGLTRLTSTLGYDGGAFFSPDGRRLVWRAMYPETAADSADYRNLLAQRLVRPTRLELWVANADGSDARQVTHLGAASSPPSFTRTAAGSCSPRTIRIRRAGTSIFIWWAWTAAGWSG